MKYGINTCRFCLLFVWNVFYLQQFVVASVRYSRNAALDGLGCQPEDSVFHEHKISNKILCSTLCTQHKTCVGFFYIAQLQECIGCRADFQSRTTTITDTEYYTRDGLRKSSAFDGLRCGTNVRISVHSNILTLAHCASTCFVNGECQSYFHRRETQQCCLCRVAYGINGANAGLELWTGSLYESRYGYLGCFDDSMPRILEGAFTSSYYMTTEMCIQRCISERRIYALTEVGSHCDCGNVLKHHGNYTDAHCNVACVGDASQVCGNHWTGSVYTIRYW